MPLFYSRYIISYALWLIKSAALLEFPEEYIESLHNSSSHHHYGDWDEIFKNIGIAKPEYDLWLNKYDGILKDSKDTPIIDLGCGYGNDTLYLHERGFEVISCDLSMQALKRLDHFIDKPAIRHFDMLAGLPFENNSAKAVIADLSIHYFPWKDTEMIVEDIRKVLRVGGYLLCRVNSTVDRQRCPREGDKIEENYYNFGERKKRFFNRKDLEKLFRAWEIYHIAEYSLDRFGSPKVLWEIALRKAG